MLVRALGLPTDPVECTGMLIPKALDDEAFKLNLGRADGRYFAVNCGAGIDAAAMLRLDRKFPPTQARYERAAFRAVASELLVGYAGKRPDLAVRIDGGAAEPSLSVMVGRTDPYTFYKGYGLRMTPEASLETGLDVLSIRKLGAGKSRGSRGRCSAPRATSRDATSTTRMTPRTCWWRPRSRSRCRSTATRSGTTAASRSTSPSRRSGSWPRAVPYPALRLPEGKARYVMSDIQPIAPHGGTLIDLLVTGDAADALRAEAANLPTLTPNERELSDLEMLAVGALSPLAGFQGEADYHSVLDTMHLTDGLAWAIPVVLGVDEADAHRLGRAGASRSSRPRGPTRSRCSA